MGRVAFLVGAIALLLSGQVWAEAPPTSAPKASRTPSNAIGPEAKQRAAAAYDKALQHYRRAEYSEAARAFLEADKLVSSSDALASAIAAARRAKEHLLVIEAARRAVSREATDPKLAAQARQAVSEASEYLARLELSCRPEPCELTLDGASVAPGRHYVLPGTHTVTFASNSGTQSKRLDARAGTTYRIAPAKAEPKPAPPTRSSGAPKAASPLDPPERDTGVALPPAVFFAGVAISAGLAAATTWSGIDTLKARNELSSTPTRTERNEVDHKIARSNWLFAGTAVASVATVATGLFLVRWTDQTQVSIAPTGLAGVGLQVKGRL